jgi:CheY-like chemotaxis protein
LVVIGQAGGGCVNAAEQKPELSPTGVRVLVAEDEVLVRLMVAEELRAQEFHVFEAVDAEEAIAILKTMQVDVVVTDLHMRAIGDGLLLAHYAREHCPGVPVLLASAQAPPVEGPRFDAFFTKPYQGGNIATWIRRHTAASPGPTEGVLP